MTVSIKNRTKTTLTRTTSRIFYLIIGVTKYSDIHSDGRFGQYRLNDLGSNFVGRGNYKAYKIEY
jgi:hypothetical protein